MQVVDGELVVSATDLTRFVGCRHLTTLDRECASGLRPAPPAPAADLELLWRRGLDHETAYLRHLRERGLAVHEIPAPAAPSGAAALVEAERRTVEAMASGAQVIYQATFFDGRWRGHADFLLRRDDLPGRWGWGYDIADTKLARRLTVPAVLQMAVYAERLTALQGVPPRELVVVTGDGVERPYRFADGAAYARRLGGELLAFLDRAPVTRPEPVRQCGRCRWQPHCRAEWVAQDHLSLVAGMRTVHADALRATGLTTVAALAGAQQQDLPVSLAGPVGTRLKRQARLQVAARGAGPLPYELLDAEPGRGLALLPEPSPGDVFFDIEGDPFVGEHGLEYLFGVVDRGAFTGYWAVSPEQERQAFEALVDHLMAAWAHDPGMHVYHYAPYERLRLQGLSGRHGTRGAEVDRLLRGHRLVDLYAVVRQGVRIGTSSYSLKKLEALYWGADRGHRGEAAVNDAMGSVVAFETWLARRSPEGPPERSPEEDGALLEGIRVYNEEDCRSTQALRDWLEGVRREAGGDPVFPRPSLADGHPSPTLRAAMDQSDRLRSALLGLLPPAARAEGAERTAEQEAIWLLAMLLDWHRREALPDWWDHFQRLTLTDQELIADPTAVGGLRGARPLVTVGRSTTWQLDFPPQETKLGQGEQRWADPRGGRRSVPVDDVRPDEGWLTLRLPARAGRPEFTALVPGPPPPATQLEQRLVELAHWVLAHGIDDPRPPWRAARD
ncbi:MAG: TM0106 family RecB-like putative nuclease, partial [Kineosporiaceae bacterium]